MSKQGVDNERRRFMLATTVVGAVGAGFVAVPFIASWQPSARAKAIGAPVEIDVSKLEPGQMLRGKWRGKPIFVVRRTEGSVEELPLLDPKLRDPDSRTDMQPPYAQNQWRSLKPEYLVLIGLCTHLGCSPTYVLTDPGNQMGADWQGGFFCPCHGSKFDLAGRVYTGVPAPTNLEVPPYKFVNDSVILVGENPTEGTA